MYRAEYPSNIYITAGWLASPLPAMCILPRQNAVVERRTARQFAKFCKLGNSDAKRSFALKPASQRLCRFAIGFLRHGGAG